ncbi:MAG: hypothetical protein HZB34_03580 [Nitrospirae bacterium]|nr:hypothetical protein [Nitrospirota bacterium]
MNSHFKSIFFIMSIILGQSLAVWTMPSEAALVTFYFNGTIAEVPSQIKALNGTGVNGFHEALPFSGRYTVDTSTPGNSGRFGVGGAINISPITQGSITIGDYTVPFTAPPSETNIDLVNFFLNDEYHAQVLLTPRVFNPNYYPVNTFVPSLFNLDITDPSGTMLDNQTTLPETPPSINGLNQTATWRLQFFNNQGQPVMRGLITSLTTVAPVPLPASALLFGIGIITLLGIGIGMRSSSLQA